MRQLLRLIRRCVHTQPVFEQPLVGSSRRQCLLGDETRSSIRKSCFSPRLVIDTQSSARRDALHSCTARRIVIEDHAFRACDTLSHTRPFAWTTCNNIMSVKGRRPTGTSIHSHVLRKPRPVLRARARTFNTFSFITLKLVSK